MFTSPLRRGVVLGGTNRKFERIAWVRSERRAGTVRCSAFVLRRHGGEKIHGYVWASGSAAEFASLGGQETGWMTYGGQKRACALCRAEYVKSKDPVNASHWSQD